MAKLTIGELKQRLSNAEEANQNLVAENEYLHSLLDAFWTGDVPQNAEIGHIILAQWGRKRRAERKQQAVLLVKQETNMVVG